MGVHYLGSGISISKILCKFCQQRMCIYTSLQYIHVSEFVAMMQQIDYINSSYFSLCIQPPLPCELTVSFLSINRQDLFPCPLVLSLAM